MELDLYTDQDIVQAILRRDSFITKEYLYRKCYPLFKAIYDKYYTDCDSVVELINEIYVYILMPHRETNQSKLQKFGFRCSLTMWLKIVTENYCHQLFTKRIAVDENSDVANDRNDISDDSFISNTRRLDMEDVQKTLSMMPNQRYGKLIEYRYILEMTNEETASLLGLTMANYYNCHKRAKAQYCEVLRKEGLICSTENCLTNLATSVNSRCRKRCLAPILKVISTLPNELLWRLRSTVRPSLIF